ncbi:MAG: DUF3667 domain-containing protein [Bacteroidales bacterium]|nr:DUF3667 domain-containing protein [Candidatus Latescibacterota bacterium]
MTELNNHTDKNCLNCGATLSGTFCSQCSQKASISRLSYRTLAFDGIRHFFVAGSPLLRTILGLFRNPGLVAREYIQGRRKTYVGPMKYCLLTAALCVLITKLSFPEGIVLSENMNEAYSQIHIQEAMNQILNFMANYQQPGLLLVLPLHALLLRLFFKGSGHNFSEQLAFSAYLYGQLNLIRLPFIPFGIAEVDILGKIFGLGLPLIFLCWWVIGFNRVKPLSGIIRAIIVHFVFYSCLSILLIVTAFILTAIQA